MKIGQWLGTMRTLCHRVAFEIEQQVRLVGAELCGGLTFPRAKGDFLETRFLAQRQAVFCASAAANAWQRLSGELTMCCQPA